MKKLTIVILLFCLLCLNSLAQLQDANWHFGVGNAISVDGTEPVLYESSISSPIDRTPATISDPFGNLLYFADNEHIFCADNSVMPNGEFAQLCDASLFIPHPTNFNQHYFIRSYSLNGLDYSIVDLTLNGGLGDVIDDAKEIPFMNIGGELMAVPKSEGIGYWLISVDNNNGEDLVYFRVFDVNEDGIVFHSEFTTYWVWIDFNSEVDDSVISPDCSTIACSFKGHYIGLCEFDSELGEVSNPIDEAVDTENFFVNITELAFSPNSDYLYSIGDFNEIQQWNVSVLDYNLIAASGQTISLQNGSTWHDLKLAPNGQIYLLNTATNSLDVIENPDLPSDDIIFTPSVLSLNNTSTTYFPNTPNVICGTTIFFDPQTIDVCIGDTTQFNFLYNSEPDSLFWEFGDPDTEELNYSELLNPSHFYEFPGSYNVTVDAWLDSLEYNFDIIANVYTYPDPQLGDDITAGEGDLVLDAGEAISYEWTPTGEGQFNEISESGTYSVIASNGPCSASDEIEVVIIPQLFIDLGPDLIGCDEETLTIVANTDVTWFDESVSDSYSVSSEGTYSASLTNECFNVSDEVVVEYLETPIVELGEDVTICEGQEIILDAGEASTYDWTPSGSNQLFTVTEGGNYAVIASNGPCSSSDQIEVTVIPIPVIFIGPDFFPCDTEPVTFVANTEVTWFDNSVSDTYTVSNSGTYTASLSNECFTTTDTAIVDYIVIPPFDLGEDINACFGDSINVFSGIPDANVTWTADWGLNTEGDTLTIASSGTYEITVNYYGCIETQTIEADFQVYVDPLSIEMPNIFTPNADDKNIRFIPLISDELLDPCNIPSLDVDMRVYNRWGGLVSPEGCFWDGRTESGDDAVDGTYYFVVELESKCYNNSATRTINGSLTLAR